MKLTMLRFVCGFLQFILLLILIDQVIFYDLGSGGAEGGGEGWRCYLYFLMNSLLIRELFKMGTILQ